MDDAAHEQLQMGRGEHQQGCERAACHGVSMERIGNRQVERPYCPVENALRALLGKETSWQNLVAIGVGLFVGDHRLSPSGSKSACLGREKRWPIFHSRGR